MKKFLTVLLALSVVFTYTVGTAFAAVPTSDVKTKAATKMQGELEKVNAAKTLYLGGITTYTGGSATDEVMKYKFTQINGHYFTKDEMELLAKAVVTQAEEALSAQYATVINGTYDDDAAVDSALAGITADGYIVAADFGTKLAALDLSTYELKFAKDRYVAVINTIDPANYSDEADENGENNRQKVSDLKEKALSDIAKATAPLNGAGSARQIAADFLTEIAKIDTIAEEGYNAKDLATAKEIAIAKMTAAYTGFKADAISAQNDIIRQNERVNPQTDATRKAIADAEEKIAKITKEYDAAIEIIKAQMNGIEKITDTVYTIGGGASTIGTLNNYVFTLNKQWTTKPLDTGLELAVKKVAKIAELKDEAALAKQYIGIEGSKYYTEDSVDEALDATIAAVYKSASEADLNKISMEGMTPAEALTARINALIGSNSKLNVVVDKKSYKTVYAWAKAVTDGAYDYNGSDEVKEAITDLADDTADALAEAKTITEAEKIFLEAYEKFNAFTTKTQYDNMYAVGGSLYAKATTYAEQIKAAVAAKHTLVDANGEYNFDKSVTPKFAANLIAKMKEATTEAELDSNFAEAKATIDNLKTVAALQSEAKALNDRANAITTPVDIAQKAEVTALLDAFADFEAYVDLIDTNKVYSLYDGLAKGYLQTIANAEAKAINDAIAAVGVVTIDDKEAIDKIVADYKALGKLVADYNLNATTPVVGDVAGLANKLSAAEVKNVKDMIATLDTSMDASNLKKVRETQKAYEALKAGQKAQITDTVYDKYLALVKLANDYEIKAVESLKITASSTAGKGYIKVKWTVKGDASTADGFRVYKSTKKNSGFGSKPYFDTKSATKMTYKNTKQLKKGTRYYYKVRAYKVVDGKTYFSDYSNKAYRIAK